MRQSYECNHDTPKSSYSVVSGVIICFSSFALVHFWKAECLFLRFKDLEDDLFILKKLKAIFCQCKYQSNPFCYSRFIFFVVTSGLPVSMTRRGCNGSDCGKQGPVPPPPSPNLPHQISTERTKNKNI